jgi:predicted DNA-binding transcriptional regulator AlpA
MERLGSFIRIPQVMEQYQISRTTLQKFLANGMPHYRVGRIFYFDPNEINDWIRSFEKTEGEVQFEEDDDEWEDI